MDCCSHTCSLCMYVVSTYVVSSVAPRRHQTLGHRVGRRHGARHPGAQSPVPIAGKWLNSGRKPATTPFRQPLRPESEGPVLVADELNRAPGRPMNVLACQSTTSVSKTPLVSDYLAVFMAMGRQGLNENRKRDPFGPLGLLSPVQPPWHSWHRRLRRLPGLCTGME